MVGVVNILSLVGVVNIQICDLGLQTCDLGLCDLGLWHVRPRSQVALEEQMFTTPTKDRMFTTPTTVNKNKKERWPGGSEPHRDLRVQTPLHLLADGDQPASYLTGSGLDAEIKYKSLESPPTNL